MTWAGRNSVTAQRFEYKYLIREPQADVVRAFALSHMVPDEHADPVHGSQYPVYSLYLDTAGLRLFRSSMAGEKNRFKLRVRWYDDAAHTPAFLEVKGRRNDVIVKQRAPVRKEAVDRGLGSFCMLQEDLTEPSAVHLASLDRFCELSTKLLAEPKVFVRYVREPYVSPDGDSMRLTMDRHIACLRADGPSLELDRPGWVDLDDRWIVLEIKFTDTFPRWACEMVRALNLVRTSAAKYVRSVEALRSWGIALA